MQTEVEYVTADEYAAIERKCAELERELAELRIFKGEEAIHAGDMWHDNPTLYRIEMEERILMRRVREAQERVRSAVIMEIQYEPNRVVIGSTVDLEFGDGDTDRIKLSGRRDGDMKERVISAFAPVGKAILGATIGETRTYSVNGKEHHIRILDIVSPENIESPA